MSELQKKPSLLFKGLINAQLVSLAPEPFALALNADGVEGLSEFEQWHLNELTGFHDRYSIDRFEDGFHAEVTEALFVWSDDRNCWVCVEVAE